jgi:MtfA peptidase
MFLAWWQQRQRKKLVAAPTPPQWKEILSANVAVVDRLSPQEQSRLYEFLKIFIAERHWEGCRGFTITEEVRVTVAAQAGILVLGFPLEYFDRVSSILVYPDNYVAQQRTMLSGGIIMEGPSAREGETWYRGPVVLSWPDVLVGGRGAERGNLVYHEFAHQLDMLNGSDVDGVPPMSNADSARWAEVLERQYESLVQCCRVGYSPVLDCYGTTNKAEFFAVTTEAFFVRPRELLTHHAELYQIFRAWYKQDPLLRESSL